MDIHQGRAGKRRIKFVDYQTQSREKGEGGVAVTIG